MINVLLLLSISLCFLDYFFSNLLFVLVLSGVVMLGVFWMCCFGW